MWIPTTEQEILAAIAAGDTEETPTFDAKEALPTKGRSKDLAKDVAAMSADGGTLLYGLAEDENKRPMVPKPFELGGVRERVDQIVQTCISEPPTIEVHEIPTDNDPSRGYLVVHVPASPRAPHMVTVGKEHRYYGRSATGNIPLLEGEVARLYERRQRWEVDQDAMLDRTIESAPIPPHGDYAYLHLFARPVVPDENLFDRASEGQQAAQFISGLMSAANNAAGEEFVNRLSPDFSGSHRHELRADGWATSWGLGVEWKEREDPSRVLDLELGFDGRGRMFCGNAARRHKDHLFVFEVVVAGLTAKFLTVMGRVYAEGGYLGPVDVGAAVTGLRGGVSYHLNNNMFIERVPYNKRVYRRTERFPASQLSSEPRGAARRIVQPLIRVLSFESYDPLSE